MRRWAGALITALIFGGVLLILFLNVDLGDARRPLKDGSSPPGDSPRISTPAISGTTPAAPPPSPVTRAKPSNFREYPIGEEIEKSGIRVAAVWLPPVQMNGQAPGASDLIHLEADVKATENNPNGFALGEFVPYLEIEYTIAPAGGGTPIQSGKLMPMIAVDGLHYGASVAMPKSGRYRLTYAIKPPSAGGLGRHSDPATGVAPWWPPFEATFDWDYPGPPEAGKGA
jgi:periplasmic iron binding protein